MFQYLYCKIIRRKKDFRITDFFFGMVIVMFLLPACKQENLRGPIDNDKVPPAPLTDVQVENLSGGAKISYVIPDDLDFFYVQANYEIRDGVKEEMQSSSYKKMLTVQGFGDTDEHEVTLYAVDMSGNKSKPVTVKINPLEPPVQETYKSLTYDEDFGGINVKFQNNTRADLVFTVLIKDPSSGEWTVYDRNYTSVKEGDFSVRGLKPLNTTFGVFVKDRWDNHSDTLMKDITPLYEVELDPRKFSGLTLPNDAKNVFKIKNLWAGTYVSPWGFKASGGLPIWLTMDLGVKAKLSRFKVWQIHDGREYSASNTESFELWGTNNFNSDGSWDSWTKLGSFEIVKPSGLPAGQNSNEDAEAAAEGHEFSLPLATPGFRYIRIKIISTFSSPPNSPAAAAWLNEVAFWGQVQ